jgi:trimethylamine--corrinoid protein Co-methyltransferase
VKIQLLTEREKDRIVREALRLLSEVGVDVAGASLRKRLAAAGAKVDPAGRVRLPPEMASELIAQVPRIQRKQRIDGEPVPIGGGGRAFLSLVLDPVIVDYETGPREPRLADVARHTRIGDALPLVNTIYKMDQGVSDLPIEQADARTLADFLCHTVKHVLAAPAGPKSLRLWIEMLEIVLDGRTLRDHPVATVSLHLKSPLRLAAFECEEIEACASRGIPMQGGACPMAGATSPFPLAGSVMQAMAETIFLGAAIQVCSPGAMFLPSNSMFAFHMREGTITAGAAESTLMSLAVAEVVHHLGLPVAASTGFADPDRVDFQAGAEAMSAMLTLHLAGVDLLSGLGTISCASGVSAEKIVMDHDLLEMSERFRQGVEVRDETLSRDAIAEAGPGGNFMESEQTLRLCRTAEHYYGGSFARGGHAAGGPSMLERAHQRVEEILATHRAAVPEVTREALQRYAREA